MKKHFFLFLFVLCFSCKEKPYQPTPYVWNLPSYFPKNMNIPDDNPMTIEGVELGNMLFHDEKLCGSMSNHPDSMMSCATCHVKKNAFDIGMNNPRFPDGRAFGRTGIYTPHNVMPLQNLVFNHNGYFWNGRIHSSNANEQQRSLEDVVSMGILAPHEMNSTINRAVAAIQRESYYPEMFRKAFGTQEINIERIEKAIAQYIRSLVSCNSKFDRYLQKKENLSQEEWAGYILFCTEEGADCFHCHGSDGNPLFTTNLFYNNALDKILTDSSDRFHITNNPSDKGAYRSPSLRNVAITAPYMHDGRYKTLDEVLAFYNFGLQNSPYVNSLMHKINDGGAQLTPKQIAQLKAFLLTLTDEEYCTQ
jgi:cytochrome c peroxidase